MAPTSVTVGCGACGDMASSWHSMMSEPVCSAGAAASTVASSRSSLGWGNPDLHPLWLSHLFWRSRTTTTCSRCPLPLATLRLQPPVGHAWDGGNPGLALPVALAGVCTDTCSRPHVHGRLNCARQCTESDVSLQELITSRCVSERHYSRYSPPDSRISTPRAVKSSGISSAVLKS